MSTYGNWVYGVLGRDGGFIHTSNTERGAKKHAAHNKYKSVYAMHKISWAVIETAVFNGKLWEQVYDAPYVLVNSITNPANATGAVTSKLHPGRISL